MYSLPHKREVRFLELQRIASFPSTKYVPCLLAARGNEGREEWVGQLLGAADGARLHTDSPECPVLPWCCLATRCLGMMWGWMMEVSLGSSSF